MTTLRTAALAALVAPTLFAGDVSVPAGFNVETSAEPAPIAGQLADGTLLYSTGSFGADEISVFADGNFKLFATGFGSVAGVAQSTVTGEIAVGDSFPSMLWQLNDLNDDGDALDAGEMVPHPAPMPIPAGGGSFVPFDLAFEPGTDTLFMSFSTFGSDPFEGGVFRIADDTFNTYADGYGFAAGIQFDGDVLYAADLDNVAFVGRITRLEDGNDDGDALDAGELIEFASGLSGASGLARDAAGVVYLSGGFTGDFSSGTLQRFVDTDNDNVADDIDTEWATGFDFSSGLTLLEGAAGFIPGAAGDGALVVTDFAPSATPRTIRTAPLATTTLDGGILSNTEPVITVAGAEGAFAVWVLTLDVTGVTIDGIGDLCVGFTNTNIMSPMLPIGVTGESSTTLVLRDLSAVAGLDYALQGFTFEGGQVGISNALFGAVDV